MVQPVIGFHVAYRRSMTSGSTIPFNVIKANLGIGWSSSYHRFTAPVKGLYYFTLSIITQWSSNGYAGAHIVRGNVSIRFVRAWRHSKIQAHIPASGSAAVMLNVGDQVWAKRHNGYLHSNSALYTHFVGFLIQKVNLTLNHTGRITKSYITYHYFV